MKYSTGVQKKHRYSLRVLLAAALVAVIGFSAGFLSIRAGAENRTVRAWVICQPGDYVNVRAKASRASGSIGRLETGDAVELDGKTRSGYAHIVNAGLEEDEAWIHAGYLAFDKPEWSGERMEIASQARVACRKYADGPVRCWLTAGAEVQVFWRTEEWSVTNRGFIKTMYLEVPAL